MARVWQAIPTDGLPGKVQLTHQLGDGFHLGGNVVHIGCRFGGERMLTLPDRSPKLCPEVEVFGRADYAAGELHHVTPLPVARPRPVVGIDRLGPVRQLAANRLELVECAVQLYQQDGP